MFAYSRRERFPLNSPHSIPVILIAHSYPPENLVGAYRPARFARYLPEHGFEPWILTASRQNSNDSRRLLEVPFSYNLVELVLGKTFFPCDDRMTWLLRAEAAAIPWIKDFPTKPILFSTSPPLVSHWLAWRLAKHFSLPWVADFRDPLVANFGRRSSLGRLMDAPIEKQVVRRASAILMNTEAAAEELRSRYPTHAAKIDALPNGYDPEDGFGPLLRPHRPYRLWFHGGSIYRNRYPERLFDSLWRLTESGKLASDWRIRLVGTLEDQSLLQRPSFIALASKQLIDINTNVLPKADALRAAAEADGSMVFDHYHSGGPNLAIPAKSFDCIRAERPILAFTSPGAPLDRLLSLCGVASVRIYEEDPPTVIDEKILAFAQLPPEPTKPSEAFRNLHGAPEQTRKLASLLNRLASEHGMLRS